MRRQMWHCAPRCNAGNRSATGASDGGVPVRSDGGRLLDGCPVIPPGANARCSDVGLECEYGSDPNPSCNQIAKCGESGWAYGGWTYPGNTGCVTATCPGSYSFVGPGTLCESAGLVCEYPEGVADDVVAVFERRDDCERVRAVLEKRLQKYGLTLHPEKTRIVDFRILKGSPETPEQGSFDFLGFTHVWRRSRRGFWVVIRNTAKGRLARSLRNVSLYCRRNRHLPILEQRRRLAQMMQGHFGYFGITGNYARINRFAHEINRIWHKWLEPRSGRKRFSWEKFNRMLARYPLLRARIIHAYAGAG
jgi:hypothetical protein